MDHNIILATFWTSIIAGIIGYYVGHRGVNGVKNDLNDVKNDVNKIKAKVKVK